MLHPRAQEIIDEAVASGRPPLQRLSPAEARQLAAAIAAMGGEPEPVARVEERTVPGDAGFIPVRVYTPRSAAGNMDSMPLLMYFHGGGWTVCDVNTHDTICRTLANSARCRVASVEYRLAPEHKFPAAFDDCYAATRWFAENAAAAGVDPKRIAVGGDSAGGNLAAAVALLARDRGGPPLIFQLLVYPVTDYYKPGTRSYEENAEGYYLTRAAMEWFWDNYLNSPDDALNPYACPMRAMALHGLPSALVITAEHDPLRDEGEAYAARLSEAGVRTKLTRYEGMFHPFFSMAGELEDGRRALAEAGAALADAFLARSAQAG